MLLRISTKHINLWVRQLELKRKAVCELAKLMRFEWIGNEIENEKNLERWGKRVTNNFPKAMRRKIYEEVDNMVWSENEKEITRWCKTQKVFDEITEKEIEEIWNREEPDEDEQVRLNGKYAWGTAKRVCDFINAHENIITISSFGEYRKVMMKVMKVIKEAHTVERKRRMISRK